MSKIITASCIIAVSASHVAPVGSAGGLVLAPTGGPAVVGLVGSAGGLILAPTGGPAVVGLGESRRLSGFQGHSGGIYSQCDANNPCNSPYVCDDRFKICSPYPNHPTAAQSAAAIAENNKLALARLRLSFAERKLKYNGNKAPRKQLARKLGNGKAPRKQLARKLSAIRNGEPMRALFGCAYSQFRSCSAQREVK